MSIRVERGQVFGFLGPNGAGKSTMVRTLLDFIRPTSGSATIFGLDCQRDAVQIKKRGGYVPGDFALYGHMTGWRFLERFGKQGGGYVPGDFGLYGHMTGWRFLERFGKQGGGYHSTAAKDCARRLDVKLERKMRFTRWAYGRWRPSSRR